MFLSAATKNSLSEVLSLVQKTVLNAITEVEEEAQTQVARLRSEADEARTERDEALKALHAAEISASRHATELSQMRAMNENLERDVLHWKDQAKNWQDHYTRVEQDRCGLSTELLTLSRTALTDSPPKHRPDTASTSVKRSSSAIRPPPAGPPSPSDSNSPLQSVIAQRLPRTPASSAKAAKRSNDSHSAHHAGEASTSTGKSGTSRAAKASGTKHHQQQNQTPSQPPRQILLRRVQAVVHVKEEDDDDHVLEDEEEEEEEPETVRIVRRGRSGLMVQDENDRFESTSDAEQDVYSGEEESGDDELIMNSRQEIYGGIHPAAPFPQQTPRYKRVAGEPQHSDPSPTKRRRVSDAARPKAPSKRK